MKVIITGSTGMVGKGVLLECLESEHVESVLVINRSTISMVHQKLKEIIIPDLSDISSLKDELNGYDACFFCLGISSLGMNEQDYTKITYDITKEFADTLYELNPNLVFNYVSGSGTDSTETGSLMWARVKGKTENLVLNKGFKDAYAFRPGAILPEKGVKSKTPWVNFMIMLLTPFFPLFKKLNSVTTSSRVGQAMINTVVKPYSVKYLENKDINKISFLSY